MWLKLYCTYIFWGRDTKLWSIRYYLSILLLFTIILFTIILFIIYILYYLYLLL